jgi:hypothetical protein
MSIVTTVHSYYLCFIAYVFVESQFFFLNRVGGGCLRLIQLYHDKCVHNKLHGGALFKEAMMSLFCSFENFNASKHSTAFDFHLRCFVEIRSHFSSRLAFVDVINVKLSFLWTFS